MVSGAACRISGMLATGPWQVVQPIPFATWIEWFEVDVTRQPIHLVPVNGTILCDAFPEAGSNKSCKCEWTECQRRRLLDARVTVTAIETEIADMMCVAEQHRLVECDLFARDMLRS